MFSKQVFNVTTFVLSVCLGCLTLGCGGPATIEDGENAIADSTTNQTASEQPDGLAADPPATLGTPEELAAVDLMPEELAAADLATSEELVGAGLATERTPLAVAASSSVGGSISRQEILSRAMYWVNRHVPYSMKGTYPDPQGRKYRTDCSGFVSMALHLPVSASTVSLPSYVRAISWSDLRAGDIVGTLGSGTGGANGHVVVFSSWADSAHTKFNTLEEKGGFGRHQVQTRCRLRGWLQARQALPIQQGRPVAFAGGSEVVEARHGAVGVCHRRLLCRGLALEARPNSGATRLQSAPWVRHHSSWYFLAASGWFAPGNSWSSGLSFSCT